ncbi:hypothetical protein ACQP00_13455 [Dactylosporangium sp. CS-047395]|uniref:hypothetical protein n=1 Tax=Dactylosporangium sp. CS-047395 TaxID=3239936 RepID=UPI003D8C456A
MAAVAMRPPPARSSPIGDALAEALAAGALRDAIAHGPTPVRGELTVTGADELAEVEAAADDGAAHDATADNAGAGATTPPSARDGVFQGATTPRGRA